MNADSHTTVLGVLPQQRMYKVDGNALYVKDKGDSRGASFAIMLFGIMAAFLWLGALKAYRQGKSGSL